jgi:hypothetical protein
MIVILSGAKDLNRPMAAMRNKGWLIWLIQTGATR